MGFVVEMNLNVADALAQEISAKVNNYSTCS
jgi:hypothetical protein